MHSVGASLGNGLATPPYICNAYAALLAHSLAASREGPLQRSRRRQYPFELQLSPIGAQHFYASRESSCHASLQQNSCAASCNLLPAHLAGASLERGLSHASLHRQQPRRSRPSLTGAPSCCLFRERVRDTPPSNSTPAPPPAVSCPRSRWLISREGHLQHLPTPTRPYPFGRLPPLHLVWCLSREGPLCHAPPLPPAHARRPQPFYPPAHPFGAI